MAKADIFEASNYLDNPETIAAYLAEALESGDPLAIGLAKAAVARALASGQRSESQGGESGGKH